MIDDDDVNDVHDEVGDVLRLQLLREQVLEDGTCWIAFDDDDGDDDWRWA